MTQGGHPRRTTAMVGALGGAVGRDRMVPRWASRSRATCSPSASLPCSPLADGVQTLKVLIQWMHSYGHKHQSSTQWKQPARWHSATASLWQTGLDIHDSPCSPIRYFRSEASAECRVLRTRQCSAEWRAKRAKRKSTEDTRQVRPQVKTCLLSPGRL